jgi:acetyltransferase-like isoleucine patch superfamily enzyme
MSDGFVLDSRPRRRGLRKYLLKAQRLFLNFRVRLASDYDRMAVYAKYYRFGSVAGQVRVTGLVHFGTEPELLSFGDRVTIADGVRFLTHDGAVALFREEFPGLVLHQPIRIGSNVFIGSDTIILPGVTIGDNCIIGAGSVVTRDIPDGTVAAGNPARPIKTTEEYRAGILRKAGLSATDRDPSI